MEMPSLLIVDDHDVNIELMEIYIESRYPRCKVYKAMDGITAMEKISQYDIDLVFLDVMLPDTDGFTVCKLMKAIRGEDYLPIIMITALNDNESLLKGLSHGADDYLTKPVSSEELYFRMRNLLKLRALTLDINHRYQTLSAEMYMAKELLKDFLPTHLPYFSHINFDIIYEPCSIIGGDFYDIFLIDKTHFGCFMTDVKGHGAAATMIVSVCKQEVTQFKEYWLEPSLLMEKINQSLYSFFKETKSDYFSTAIYYVFDTEKNTITYCNAGHPPAIYFHEGRIDILSEATGIPLGIFESSVYASSTIAISSHSDIITYTDGIFELPLFYKEARTFKSMEEIISFLDSSGIIPTPSLLLREFRYALSHAELTDDTNVINLGIS